MKVRRPLAAFMLGLALQPTGMLFSNGLISNANAGSTTTTMTVSATVPINCNFTGGSVTLAFGSYDPIGANATSDLATTTSFGLRCTKGATATLGMNNGSNADGAQRRMSGGASNFLNYQIYTNNTYATIWDNANTVGYTATNSSPTTINVYGKIPAGQNVASGTYQDTVVITANY